MKLPPSIHTNLPAPVSTSSQDVNEPGTIETNTDGYTSKALSSTGVILSLLKSVIEPVPYGADGSQVELDVDYEEKVVKAILAFVQLGAETLTDEERPLLGEILGKYTRKEGCERWSLTTEEWSELEKASKTA